MADAEARRGAVNQAPLYPLCCIKLVKPRHIVSAAPVTSLQDTSHLCSLPLMHMPSLTYLSPSSMLLLLLLD